MLALEGVTVRFGETLALDDVSLAFAGGRTTVLVGPSGCGKSTILRLFAGLVAATEGEVRVDGAPFPVAAALAGFRRRLGYVIQEGGLFPHMTAGANVTLLARHLGRPADWIDRRVAELCQLVDLETALLGRYPRRLSGGQRQRIALMRGLMLDPDILLLDEPMGALDAITRYDLQADLKAIFARLGKTVILVTHDLGEAAFFADRLVLMGHGHIVQQGNVDDLLRRPANDFVRRFVAARRDLPEAGR